MEGVAAVVRDVSVADFRWPGKTKYQMTPGAAAMRPIFGGPFAVARQILALSFQ